MIDADQPDIRHYFLSRAKTRLQLSAPALQGISSVPLTERERERAHTWAGLAGGQLSLTRTICLQHTQPHATQTLSDNLVGEIQTRPSVSYYETLDKALGEARQTSSFEKSKQ